MSSWGSQSMPVASASSRAAVWAADSPSSDPPPHVIHHGWLGASRSWARIRRTSSRSLSNTTREALRGFMVLQWSTTRAGKCLQNRDAGGFRQDRDSGPENDIGYEPRRPRRGAHREVGSVVSG